MTTAAGPLANNSDNEGADANPPSPRIAALLAVLFNTTGLVYAGRLRRALAWVLLQFLSLIVIVVLLLYLPYGRVAWVAMAVLVLASYIGPLIDAVWAARNSTAPRQWYQRWWYSAIYYLLVSLGMIGTVHLTRAYWEEAFYIPTGSMASTILAGDRILVDKLRYRFKPIRNGDVVVYWLDDKYANPYQPSSGRRLYVKRVIGVPGDSIEFRDERLFRNGEPVDEPYAIFLPTDAPAHSMAPPINTTLRVIPEGHYFLVGDNRRNSLDSRSTGDVSRDDIVGKAAVIYWSREPVPPERPASGHAFDAPTKPEPAPPRGFRWERFGQRVE